MDHNEAMVLLERSISNIKRIKASPKRYYTYTSKMVEEYIEKFQNSDPKVILGTIARLAELRNNPPYKECAYACGGVGGMKYLKDWFAYLYVFYNTLFSAMQQAKAPYRNDDFMIHYQYLANHPSVFQNKTDDNEMFITPGDERPDPRYKLNAKDFKLTKEVRATVVNENTVAVIKVLHEYLDESAYNAFMNKAVELTESNAEIGAYDAMLFASDTTLDENAKAIIEAVINEAILNEGFFNSPLKKHLRKLKEIKDTKPKDYDGPEVAKKFIDANYDELVKTARLLEKEPTELRRNDIVTTTGTIVLWLGGYIAAIGSVGASITVGPAIMVGGVAAMILGVVLSMINMVIGYMRTGHDRDAADQLAKIRRALKKIDLKKLPESHRKKIEDCLEAIDDAETAISARIKVANENANVMAAIWGTDNDN